MKGRRKRVLAFALSLAMVFGCNAIALAAETKTYQFKDYKGVKNIVVTNVISDNVKGELDVETSDAALKVKKGATITCDFTIYGSGLAVDDAKTEESYTADSGVYKIIKAEAVPDGYEIGEFSAYAIELIKEGTYIVSHNTSIYVGAAPMIIEVVGDSEGDTVTEKPAETPVKDPVAPEKVIAKATNASVVVNGKAVAFEAYQINQNNYFKLRDVAQAVSGDKKQFDLTWDATKKAINLISGKAYATIGGEAGTGDMKDKEGVLSTAAIYKDGQEIALTAYLIDGNTYFKLRDLCQAFDIAVTWDGTTNSIGIDTSKGYVVK